MDEIKGTPGIVGLFGHSTIAGFISADTMFGDPMVRVDVPETTKFPAFTRHYGVKAVYEIDWCSEEVMKAAVENAQVRPIAVYIPQLVSREAHDKAVDELREEIERLRGVLLPEPSGHPNEAVLEAEYPRRFDDEGDDEE